MATPLVSIVTPTLNQGGFIEQTIRSIKAQTYRHYEHIVIDGGSTDQTLDILRRHEGTYAMRWVSEPDSGMYDAINKGLRQASGDILAYVNSDDLYFPWTLDVVVQAFERQPEADLISGDCVRVNPGAGSAYLILQPPPYPDWVMRTGYLAQPTVFWRRRVLETTGKFDDSLRYVADCDYWMRAMQSHRLVHLREFLAVDTIQPDAYRSAMASKLADETEAVRQRYVVTHGLGHAVRQLRNRIWGAFWRRALWLDLLAERHFLGRVEPRHWRRWQAGTSPQISTPDALMAQIPSVGDRYAWRAIKSGGTPDA